MLGQDTLPALLRAAAEEYGAHPAYVEASDGHSRVVSYAELKRLVEATSEVYVNGGVCCADKIVVWGPNSIDWAVAALAVSYCGAVLVPVNSRYVGAEVADIVARTGAKLVVVHDGFLGRSQWNELLEARVHEHAEITTLAHLMTSAQGAEGLQHEDVQPDDVADILFTSGTTGRSKGAMSAHRQTIGVARAWAELGGVCLLYTSDAADE